MIEVRCFGINAWWKIPPLQRSYKNNIRAGSTRGYQRITEPNAEGRRLRSTKSDSEIYRLTSRPNLFAYSGQ